MADGWDDTGDILEAAKSRKVDKDERDRASGDARDRQKQLENAFSKLKDFRFAHPEEFWKLSVDPLMELGETIRGMKAARHLDVIVPAPKDHPIQYALGILQCAAGDDREGVRKLTADLVESDVGAEFRDIVAAKLCDNLMELVARADWAAIFPDAPEKPIDRWINRDYPNREPEPINDRVAELSARIQWWADQREQSDAAPAGESEAGGKIQEPTTPPQYITLDQMAARVNRSKKTLERYCRDQRMPKPNIEGGGGRPHEWEWRTIRPWLQDEFGRILPVSLPDIRG